MKQLFPDYAQLANLPLIEEFFYRYQKGEEIDPSWRHFFEGIDFAEFSREAKNDPSLRIFSLIQAYRRYGHLQAAINPLSREVKKIALLELKNLGFSEGELGQLFPSFGLTQQKQAPLREIISTLTKIYCGTVGFEYMHLEDSKLEQWIQQQIERAAPETNEEKHLVLESLIQSELFEQFLHTKFVGQKRFSLEGEETLIPILTEIIEEGSKQGIVEFFFGMAHRGRLNVLVNLFGKSYSTVFREFEDLLDSIEESGDVKYHKGYSAEITTRSQKKVRLHLAANPSHLESVDPVCLGQTRARQDQNIAALTIMIHGDAALAGQGVVYESLQLMNLPGYTVRGAIHIVLNNQIGFTTLPQEGRSTRYCTDIAKSFSIPIFHLNAEDPDGALFAAKLALRIRNEFKRDVFLDLNGYRKYGHNEGDEPAFTQPLHQSIIKKKPSIREIYYQKNQIEENQIQQLETAVKSKLTESFTSSSPSANLPQSHEPIQESKTAVDESILREILKKTSTIPERFHLHPKLQKMVQERVSAKQYDWNTAEWLAFGSLLLQGIPIRMSGQDSQRGTFSQRHMVWIDQETETRWSPLAHLKEGQTSFEIINSPLSEYAALGFELGYTWSAPETFVLWEAQFGDFFNGAQIIVDQYLSSAEQKWNRSSSLVLLLPHGFEGQGPEHSSGRLERFLQLCAKENLIVANVSTPAQYFHLLRKQALGKNRKPLVIFTPKSLLRTPACTSTIDEFTQGSFEEILDDSSATEKCRVVLLCSGHVYYDLLEQKKSDTALIRIEQYYPFQRDKLKNFLSRYRKAEVRFVQEEPQNMGAWNFLKPQLEELASIKYVGREPSASPATGSHRKHEEEKKKFLHEAYL